MLLGDDVQDLLLAGCQFDGEAPPRLRGFSYSIKPRPPWERRFTNGRPPPWIRRYPRSMIYAIVETRP